MTERELQAAIYDYRRSIMQWPVLVPNVVCWSWECDLLYISKSFYATEYEIKLSVADYRADKRKYVKHKRLSYAQIGPKYFYYVCPENIIDPAKLPEYAGLFYAIPRNNQYDFQLSKYRLEIIKKAPYRKVPPLSSKQYYSVLNKGVSRYWDMRMKYEGANLK
jgi:hypothetical protein